MVLKIQYIDNSRDCLGSRMIVYNYTKGMAVKEEVQVW